VTFGVVDNFESVDIDHGENERSIRPSGTIDLMGQSQFTHPSSQNSGQLVETCVAAVCGRLLAVGSGSLTIGCSRHALGSSPFPNRSAGNPQGPQSHQGIVLLDGTPLAGLGSPIPGGGSIVARRRCVRNDVTVRWGGAESVCGLSDVTMDTASERINDIQKASRPGALRLRSASDWPNSRKGTRSSLSWPAPTWRCTK
jgi:hypothetical protein